MNKAIFLDRDGVLNKVILKDGKPLSPKNLSEFVLLDNVSEALAIFKKLDYLTIIVTNQPDIKTKKQTLKDLEITHKWIFDNLMIDDIFVCCHDDSDNCNCRKPGIGMLINASKKYKINLTKSIMIGDRWKDIKCGQLAKCKNNFYINYGYDEPSPTGKFINVSSLYECSKIVESMNEKNNER